MYENACYFKDQPVSEVQSAFSIGFSERSCKERNRHGWQIYSAGELLAQSSEKPKRSYACFRSNRKHTEQPAAIIRVRRPALVGSRDRGQPCQCTGMGKCRLEGGER